ncbi:hypothetical protein PAHAL_5G451200 [Panicum hallii]|uniref:Uncharacterized protein n=1 Tax=Panicum hallii TaxID=206008 RepID=A0A2T8INE4_9POAL|nr:hypothetical protein PAHAL_5G451200 [Panicum hallii]
MFLLESLVLSSATATPSRHPRRRSAESLCRPASIVVPGAAADARTELRRAVSVAAPEGNSMAVELPLLQKRARGRWWLMRGTASFAAPSVIVIARPPAVGNLSIADLVAKMCSCHLPEPERQDPRWRRIGARGFAGVRKWRRRQRWIRSRNRSSPPCSVSPFA